MPARFTTVSTRSSSITWKLGNKLVTSRCTGEEDAEARAAASEDVAGVESFAPSSDMASNSPSRPGAVPSTRLPNGARTSNFEDEMYASSQVPSKGSKPPTPTRFDSKAAAKARTSASGWPASMASSTARSSAGGVDGDVRGVSPPKKRRGTEERDRLSLQTSWQGTANAKASRPALRRRTLRRDPARQTKNAAERSNPALRHPRSTRPASACCFADEGPVPKNPVGTALGPMPHMCTKSRNVCENSDAM
mmetsp:Transcript_97603/g.276119  ORF Transcript_97603/g.276119 Transcript_97603/m.276119 type:complete len:250 (+) Transcript_97603:1136-1885(+)